MCHGCGQIGHFIQQCLVIEPVITAGKCRRNHEGKVILNTGAFVPWSIPGTMLNEWKNGTVEILTRLQAASYHPMQT